MKNLKRVKAMSVSWYPIHCFDEEFEVRNIGNKMYSMSLKNGTCSCKMGHVQFICQYVVASIFSESKDLVTYISKFYYKEYFMTTYSDFIQPMTSSSKYKKTSYTLIVMPLPIL